MAFYHTQTSPSKRAVYAECSAHAAMNTAIYTAGAHTQLARYIHRMYTAIYKAIIPHTHTRSSRVLFFLILFFFKPQAHTRSSRVRVVVLNTFGGNPGKEGAEIKAAVHQWVDTAQEQGEAFAAKVANELRCHILGV